VPLCYACCNYYREKDDAGVPQLLQHEERKALLGYRTVERECRLVRLLIAAGVTRMSWDCMSSDNTYGDRRVAERHIPDLVVLPTNESFYIVVEVDENAHSNETPDEHVTRMNAMAGFLGDRPVVFVRYNPDLANYPCVESYPTFGERQRFLVDALSALVCGDLDRFRVMIDDADGTRMASACERFKHVPDAMTARRKAIREWRTMSYDRKIIVMDHLKRPVTLWGVYYLFSLLAFPRAPKAKRKRQPDLVL